MKMVGRTISLRNVIKSLYFITMGGLMMIILFNGINRCKKTDTVRFLITNIPNYLKTNTKCKNISDGHPFLGERFLNNLFPHTIEKWVMNTVMNTIYNVYKCNEYSHLGHEVYCQTNTCFYPKKMVDDIYEFVSSLGLSDTFHTLSRNVKLVYRNTELFGYFFAGNLKSDYINVINDLEMCYNNTVSPILLLMSIHIGSGLFLRLFIQRKIRQKSGTTA